MRFNLLLILIIICLHHASFAQDMLILPTTGKRTCGTDSYIEKLKQNNAAFNQQQQQLEQAVQQASQNNRGGQYLQQATVSIPVVFHVIYNTPEENISDEQLLSQLSILNADFRRKNADAAQTPSYFQPFAADTEIEFCLATLDPNGETSTGITRTKTNKVSFHYLDDEMKYSSRGGKDGWDKNQYLNIWVCRIADNVLGFATPPGAPAATDGVVLHWGTIGAPPFNKVAWKYNLGRTATHEVGHWLGLKHIWGSGESCTDSDNIDDTPNQLGENVGCPSGIKLSCDNGPYGDMYMNYMDYTDDACMNLFTFGQATRMKAILSIARGSIYSSLACSATLRSNFKTELATDTIAIAGKSIKFKSTSTGLKPTSYKWEFEGGMPSISTDQDPVVTYTKPGKFNVKLTISNGSLSSVEEKTNYMHVTVNDLVVYPNPASDLIIIEQPAHIMVRQVKIVNHVGRTIKTLEARQRELRIDTRSLPAGIYFLYITSTNGSVVRRLSIVR
jgi:hypothetical protein